MAYSCDKIRDYCPYFKVGECRHGCNYLYHYACPDNYLCPDMDCMMGHNISLKKREYITDIYYKNKTCDCKDIKSNLCCKRYFDCFNKNCTFKHTIDYEFRMMISNIVKSETDDDAKSVYRKYVNKYKLDNVSKTSQTSQTSKASTISIEIPIVSKVSTKDVSYVNIVKNDINDNDSKSNTTMSSDKKSWADECCDEDKVEEIDKISDIEEDKEVQKHNKNTENKNDKDLYVKFDRDDLKNMKKELVDMISKFGDFVRRIEKIESKIE